MLLKVIHQLAHTSAIYQNWKLYHVANTLSNTLTGNGVSSCGGGK